ncbi:hypothetical protein LY78DRAFT_661265 [Colletotrichum sublineola]|nr:hypothetical protein LY78DRAFT_661265 [Colletotrichum sublineola]
MSASRSPSDWHHPHLISNFLLISLTRLVPSLWNTSCQMEETLVRSLVFSAVATYDAAHDGGRLMSFGGEVRKI